VLAKRRRGAPSYGLFSSDRSGRPAAAVARRVARGSVKLKRKRWTHLAVTYDGAMLRLFVNGKLVREGSRHGKLLAGSGPLRIGGTPGRHFRGQIDDVRIYDRALSRDELGLTMRSPV
jgi:hypothetical protein